MVFYFDVIFHLELELKLNYVPHNGQTKRHFSSTNLLYCFMEEFVYQHLLVFDGKIANLFILRAINTIRFCKFYLETTDHKIEQKYECLISIPNDAKLKTK